MIYFGYYNSRLKHVQDAFPELKYMTEKEMIRWATVEKLDGLWVNNHYLLTKIAPEYIRVILKDGTEHDLVSHPKWRVWKDEMHSSEFLTFLDLETW